MLRVRVRADSREVVVLTRPFVLLRFRRPEYETTPNAGTVTWPIDRGVLVAPDGRGRGYLRLTVVAAGRATAAGRGDRRRVSSEVVNFYPLIAGWGWFTRIGRLIYNETQLRIHVIVTNAFLRSLANLELERVASRGPQPSPLADYLPELLPVVTSGDAADRARARAHRDRLGRRRLVPMNATPSSISPT